MPGYGYRDASDRDRDGSPEGERDSRKRPRGERERGAERAEKKAKKEKKQKKRAKEDGAQSNVAGGDRQRGDRGERGDRGDRERGASSRNPPPASGAQDAGAGRGAWRKELESTKKDDANEDVDGEDASSDDHGMIIKQETDEDVAKKLAESRARREALIAKWINRGEGEGGGFQTLDTNTSMHDEGEESDGEVAAFFAKQKELQETKPMDEKEVEDKKAVNRFILQARMETDGDMFGEEDEAQEALNKASNQAQAIGMTGASGDDWNDVEGYYKAKVGEVMADRYLVTEDNCGKGVFSNVIKAKDQQDGTLVAIKIMRCNDMMRKAAEKEVEVLERLAAADRGNKRNVIRLLRHFNYRDHLCLVFECMWDNLRMAVKKYTKDKGMSLKAVRAYTRQLLVALHHIHRCELIHADIKPDNILITAGHNLVKICDLGSAVELTEVEQTPYLVSRYYRAPEICLGAKYGPPADTWAMGATLCELFTGRILFPGKSNNDMMRLFMELKGKPPHKMIKSGMCWKQHFDENLDFKYLSHDKLTRKKITKTMTDCSAKKSVLDLVLARVGPEKQKSDEKEDQIYVKKAKQFADLINQMTVWDPEKRASPEELLQHPFVADSGFGPSKATPAPAKPAGGGAAAGGAAAAKK